MSINDRNLLICLTPLQMMIASRIIDEKPGVYDLLCLSYNDNAKYDYYFSQLSIKCDQSYRYIIESQSKISRLLDLFKFKKKFQKYFQNKFYQNTYLASVENNFCHLALSSIQIKNIFTFDDGTANIFKNSIFFESKNNGIIQNIVLSILGNRYDLNKIKILSQLHYTIYPGLNNIIENTKAISIFNNVDIKSEKVIKIYLGQPLENFNLSNTDNIFKYLKDRGVLNYFPHPREIKREIGFNYIETSLIFEDYVSQLLQQGYFVELYTVLSSAALNVNNSSNVAATILLEPELLPKYQGLYNLFSDAGCKIEDL